MTRWDKPLFTVLWDDESPPGDAIWDALMGKDGEGKVVKPHAATILVSDSVLCCLCGRFWGKAEGEGW